MQVLPENARTAPDAPRTRSNRRFRGGIAALGVVALATGGAVFGAGTAAADPAPAPTLSATVPAELTTGAAPVDFTGTATNPAGAPAIAHALFTFSITGDPGLQANQITLEYQQGEDYLPLPLTGSTADNGKITGDFGPATGFPFPAGANNITNFRIAVAAGAPAGEVTTQVALEDLDATPRTVASATGTTVITAGAADLQVGLDSPLNVPAGSSFDTKVSVANNGPQSAGPLETTVFVPAGYTVDVSGTTAGSESVPAPFGLGQLIVFRAAGLAAMETVTYTVHVTAPEGFGFGLTAAYSLSQTADDNIFNNVALGLNSSF